MDQQEFQKKLAAVLARAESRGSHTDKEEIREFFRDDTLTEEQLEMICDYLLSKKIVVEGYHRAGEDREERRSLSPEDEKFLRMYREQAKSVPPCGEEEKSELFRKARQGDNAAVGRLTELYMLPVAELAGELNSPEVPAADLVQEGNLHLLLALRALPEGEQNPHEWLMARVREGMEALAEQQTDVHRRDRKMVKRVDDLKAGITALREDLGRKVYLDELADYMKISEEEVEAVLKLAGEDVPQEE